MGVGGGVRGGGGQCNGCGLFIPRYVDEASQGES